MLKYTTAQVVFAEIPDEITLAIEISNCPIHCPDCHSKHLWENVGTKLNFDNMSKLINDNKGITCVCFMGGDSDLDEVFKLGVYIQNEFNLKIAFYTGSEDLPAKFWVEFDYLKLGPYIEEFGPLNSRNTNQCLLEKDKNLQWKDITYKFWR